MSMFGSIMSKIFDAAGSVVQKVEHPSSTPPAEIPPAAATPAPDTPAPVDEPVPPTSQAPAEPVDVEAVLANMASQKAGGGNWRTSIVDLLKLLDLDSSLSARNELAGELNTHVGANGSAEENIALHKAVMRKLADNGGKVPDAMKV